MVSFIKLSLVAPVVLILSTIIFLPSVADDEIGLYFDEEATVNCSPESDSFPESKDVYLILKNCSSAGGVGGWEGAFSLPAGCYITSSYLGPESINFGTVPEYLVGFGDPLPQATTMVLASFTFLFTAPGEVFLHAPEQNSIEGVFGPLYLEGGGSNLLVPVEYSFGSPFEVVMSIGVNSCPQQPTEQMDPIIEDLGWPESSVSQENSLTKGSFDFNRGTGKTISLPDNINDLWANTELGFVGTVSGYERGCFEDDEALLGLIRIDVEIDEIFWGPNFNSVSMWVEGITVENCTGYDPSLSFSRADRLEVGDEIAAFCNLRDNVFWSRPWRVYLGDSRKGSSIEERGLGRLRGVEKEQGLQAQLLDSDLVALVVRSVKSQDKGLDLAFEVKVAFVGGEETTDEIFIRFPYGFNSVVGGENENLATLLFLEKNGEGLFKLKQGNKSIFQFGPNGFFDIFGTLVDIKNIGGEK